MQNVLVTGGCGIIGQRICSGLLKKGYAVIAADKEESDYNTGKLNYTFVQCSPTDKNTYAEIFEKNEINVVIHAACTVDNDLGPIVTDKEIDESKQCDKFIYRYAMTTETVKKVVLVSTDQVYEFPKTREPIREDADIKTNTNYGVLKYASEKALIAEMKHNKEVVCCICRVAPVYTFDYVENLMAKITDPKDGTKFVSGQGTYGFQLCCVHNLVDFILCFVKSDETNVAGVYNVSDKLLTTAADIINFLRENHSLRTVLQRSGGGALSKIKGLFGGSKDEKTNYRYLDMSKLENNNMLDNTKASKLCNFRWDLSNTK